MIRLLALACLLASPAWGQSNCADRARVVASLSATYGESFAGGGLQSAQQIIEVWYSEEKGTWTILMTRADGRSCIMASGTNWRGPDQVKAPQGVPG